MTNGAAAMVIACVPLRGLSMAARRAAMKKASANAHQGRSGDAYTGSAAT